MKRKEISLIILFAFIIGLFAPGALRAQADPKGTIDTAWISAASDFTLHVTAKTDSSVSAPKVRFEGAGREETTEGTVADGVRRFDFTGIYAQYMIDEITITLLDGTEVLDTKTFSIRGYFETLYAADPATLGVSGEQYAALKTLMADALVLGAAAQNYVNYRTDDPADSPAWVAAERTQVFTSPASDTEIVVMGTAEDRITSASLLISNYIRIRFKANATMADRLTVTAGDGSPAVFMLGEKEDDGKYHVSVGGLSATDYDTVWTVSLTDSEGNEYSTIRYSVNSYVAAKADSEDTALSAMVKAIYVYGASADAYAAIEPQASGLIVVDSSSGEEIDLDSLESSDLDEDEKWGPLL
ncbi:MAG: hypothetical protein IJS22_09010 [Lachnospiraceae bacterium]|nr:hypothetical protein [Lachnospiraceae bacterium]